MPPDIQQSALTLYGPTAALVVMGVAGIVLFLWIAIRKLQRECSQRTGGFTDK